uniref:Uncharacterized protein n=1 Tax=Panagrolaimus sp. JU765 TaxID=591449 RepID=A0AC34RM96_9BILA
MPALSMHLLTHSAHNEWPHEVPHSNLRAHMHTHT